MNRFESIKEKYPEAIILIQDRNFYESYGADAVRIAEATGLRLTHKKNGGRTIPAIMFASIALDDYLPELVRRGHKVGICTPLN